MATGLPSMAYGDGISKRKQVKFGGYNHTLAAENGDLWDIHHLGRRRQRNIATQPHGSGVRLYLRE